MRRMAAAVLPDALCPRERVLRRVAIALVLLTLGCGGPPLKPWHTEELTGEFNAASAKKIRTFADYRQLEDALFTELGEKVYARTATGPEHTLARYSAGSAADPRDDQPDWNRSFELSAEAPAGGVLLLHGMSDSPYSLRALGEALRRRGYWVLGLRLPGHGTAPSGLKHTRTRDMAAAVRLAMGHLSSTLPNKHLHMVGYSTGAALALDFTLDAVEGSASPVPASLVLISPAIRVHSVAALARFKNALSVVPGLGNLAWLQVLPEFDPYKYNSFATNAADVVHRLTRSVDRRVAARTRSSSGDKLPPILVFKSTVDSTVTTEAVVDRLLTSLAPHRHELVLFDINRFAAKSTLLASDPAPLTDRLMADTTLPFAVTLVTNQNSDTNAVVAHRKAPFSEHASETERLDLAWPLGVISLSHVALPFPPDDPLYGRRPPQNEDILFLGEMALRGEHGLLELSGDWLLRMRWNPFYRVLEQRVLEWFHHATEQEAP